MFDFENYTKKEITLGIGKTNVMAFITTLPFLITLAIPFFLIWGSAYLKPFVHVSVEIKMAVIMGSIILGILVHELIHGLTWSLFLKRGFRSIKFGVIWKMLTPYCHSKEPLKVWQYMLGGLMPGFLLGVIPSLAAWITGNIFLLIYGLIFIFMAGGDLTLIWMLRKEKRKDWVLDHSEKVGCFIYQKKQDSKEK